VRKLRKRFGIGWAFIGISVLAVVVVAGVIYTIWLTNQFCPKEWTDYFQFNGITYSATGKPSAAIDAGDELATVKRQLIGEVCEDYAPQDGDASILEKGTPVYTVKGYAPFFRLVVQQGNEVQLYQVSYNPQAQQGSDLFDIRGRVRSIDVYHAEITGHQEPVKIATISEPTRVTMLVNSVLAARIDAQLVSNAEPVYLLVFHLNDDTSLSCPYWINLNMLQHGLRPSSEFQSAIREIIQ
jgi:hypothetical protein